MWGIVKVFRDKKPPLVPKILNRYVVVGTGRLMQREPKLAAVLGTARLS